jgi:hypothetical protein
VGSAEGIVDVPVFPTKKMRQSKPSVAHREMLGSTYACHSTSAPNHCVPPRLQASSRCPLREDHPALDPTSAVLTQKDLARGTVSGARSGAHCSAGKRVLPSMRASSNPDVQGVCA